MYYLTKANQILSWLVFRVFFILPFLSIKSHLNDSDGGIQNTHGYIIAANHQRYLDSFIITGSIPLRSLIKLAPVHWMAYRELFEAPPLRWFLRSYGSFPTKPIAGLDYGLPYSTKILAKNGTVALFPEGKRVRNGDDKVQARSGVSVLAAEPNVRLILCHVNWNKGFFPKAEITIGAPRNYAGIPAQQILNNIYMLPHTRSRRTATTGKTLQKPA